MRKPRLVDVHTAAEYTGRPVRTLYRWHHEGKVTRWQRHGKHMFDLRELPEKNHPTRNKPARHTQRTTAT